MKEILARAKQLILKPKETWEIIKAEEMDVQSLFINYAAPLALIPAVSSLIGLSIVGVKMLSGKVARAPFMDAVTAGVVSYVLNLLGVLAGAWVVNYLSPYFNSKQDFNSAAKLVVYALTPFWLIGIVSVFPNFDVLQVLALLFGSYSIYLLYKGFPVLLETPREKCVWFTVFTVIAGILISFALSIIIAGGIYGPMLLRMMAV